MHVIEPLVAIHDVEFKDIPTGCKNLDGGREGWICFNFEHVFIR